MTEPTLRTGQPRNGTAAQRAARRADAMAREGAREVPRDEADPQGEYANVPDGVPFAVITGPMGPGVHGPMLPRILERIRAGLPRTVAAQSCGVPKSVFSTWCHLDWLREHVEAAEGSAIHTLLTQVVEAARRGQWQAAAWTLERRWPHLFARVEGGAVIDPSDTSPLTVQFTFDEGESAAG